MGGGNVDVDDDDDGLGQPLLSGGDPNHQDDEDSEEDIEAGTSSARGVATTTTPPPTTTTTAMPPQHHGTQPSKGPLRMGEKLRVPAIVGRRGVKPQAVASGVARATAAVAAPLVQRERPRSAPRERKRHSVKLPESDLLEDQRRRQQQYQAAQVAQARRSDATQILHVASEDDPEHGGASSGRISVYCVAEKFDKARLRNILASQGKRRLCDGVSVRHVNLMAESDDEDEGEVISASCQSTWTGAFVGDVFFFLWGVVVFWGFEPEQEAAVLRDVVRPACDGLLSEADVEDEEFRFQVSDIRASERASMRAFVRLASGRERRWY